MYLTKKDDQSISTLARIMVGFPNEAFRLSKDMKFDDMEARESVEATWKLLFKQSRRKRVSADDIKHLLNGLDEDSKRNNPLIAWLAIYIDQ